MLTITTLRLIINTNYEKRIEESVKTQNKIKILIIRLAPYLAFHLCLRIQSSLFVAYLIPVIVFYIKIGRILMSL